MLDLRRRLVVAFHRTADVLEESARLADDDAERQARRGQTDLHATERARAARARDGAHRARINAQRLGQHSPLEHDERNLLQLLSPDSDTTPPDPT
jgi:hypothetical protein